ncbi:coenzyme F420 hydrogenase subunit beta [Desulfacinum hydrothermale DSM 13146]|uniref:Coenzyme F420 hydrogenase subunit beta n=1 Tax=Desulfacinum hydrothermale DSM 13146 TaxID=1121390 RepID=A0A1W1XR74_9BACT|nr:Coenzyme F420 hydrogenase/dehydrogenase, beta subunit C-terminal domain [Desulfacinum hydrothermale]SMC26011.1 coenzyme F420 hydrogenase subunit beta [Desulfacinum hydrothermale DSM 13146]
MKTFFDLQKEVVERGLCHRCGGCVSLCTAVNYGALELGPDGHPRYKDVDRCIECGLCHAACPENPELEAETRQRLAWSAPIGRILGIRVARALDPQVRQQATDGGVVTALLLHLLDTGHIDGAIVARQTGPFHREPTLAVRREEILEGAGFHFDTTHSMVGLGREYAHRHGLDLVSPKILKGLHRVALVGTPCQIHAFRRLETLGVMPSESVALCLGLFCSGNFAFGEEERARLAEAGGFSWADVVKINVKDTFQVHLRSGDVIELDLHILDTMKHPACHYCQDYAAEVADISFGGIGAPEGWTTVVSRTPKGRAAFLDTLGHTVEEYDRTGQPDLADRVLEQLMRASAAKRRHAQAFREQMTRGASTRR